MQRSYRRFMSRGPTARDSHNLRYYCLIAAHHVTLGAYSCCESPRQFYRAYRLLQYDYLATKRPLDGRRSDVADMTRWPSKAATSKSRQKS